MLWRSAPAAGLFIPEKLAQITKRPAAPVEMHKWDAPNWMLVAKAILPGISPQAGISDKRRPANDLV
jgi:hypothetical protein